MTWARHAGSMQEQEQGRFAEARAEEKIHSEIQNGRAARTVANNADNAEDCASLLQMLGLDPLDGKRTDAL